MRPSSALLENLIQQNYSGTDLPPLWQVIYQEALRGHHLLFQPGDVEAFEGILNGSDVWLDEGASDAMEEVIVSIVSCNELSEMVRIIDALPVVARRNLYSFYQRILWMWRNYCKERLN